MKHQTRTFLLIMVLTAGLISCNTNPNKNKDKDDNKSHLPKSVGKTSELLVIMNEPYWNGSMGDSVRSWFGQDVPGLPQVEPCFTTPNVNMSLLNNRMFKTHRNIFIADIDEKYQKAFIETKEDLWASPQRVVRVNSPDLKGFNKMFDEYRQAFLTLYHNNEIRRIQTTFKAGEKISIRQKLMRDHQISMVFPEGFMIAKEFDNILWIRKETQTESQGLLISFEAYENKSQFDKKNLIMRRNVLTRKHIPGPTEGSYMKVSAFYEPDYRQFSFHDNFAVEMRGLWDVENDFMGGPFLSYSFYDEKLEKLVTLDSYVYAPGSDKRDLLLQMEAIMKTYKSILKK